MKIQVFLALVLCSAVLLPACGTQEGQVDNVLKIAVIAPFSGDFELWGQSTRNGVVLAVEVWNQRGGALGQTVQVALLDSACDYTTAREVALEAIEEHDAQFIIGALRVIA